ncbi:hypothetical protein [Otoolea muris]|uniref:hypothetical protein n=1 Tax=Otoolea muris TaxID=2941515 RepID=UPI00203B3F21|nr:hypothetical protein [Otoolea muris]
MSSYELALDRRAKEIEWENDTCDQYDYRIAAFCGLAAGVIDALFVGAPGQGALGRLTDKGADALVQKIAVMLWKGDKRSSAGGRPRRAPDTLERAISYLEQAFPVNYDARYAADLRDTGGALSSMAAKNHHLLSLAHSPDLIGLIFSILDQFTGGASFLYKGRVIRLIPVKDARGNKTAYMQGTTFSSKLFCGICNWLGHLASDLCGSSSTRREGKTGRGAGLPIPFYNLLLLMNFGNFDGASFAELAVKVFEEGYDLRHGAAMAVPVMVEECSIKLIWALKRRFYAGKDWSECIPSSKHADLRIMLLVGNAALCLVDAADAAIRAAVSGGSPLTFVLHLNLIAWARLITLIFKELRIRYGAGVDGAFAQYLAAAGLNDAYALRQYYERMNRLDATLEQKLTEFVRETEKEYERFINGVNQSLNPACGTPRQRQEASVAFARRHGAAPERIMETPEQLREWLGGADRQKKR